MTSNDEGIEEQISSLERCNVFIIFSLLLDSRLSLSDLQERLILSGEPVQSEDLRQDCARLSALGLIDWKGDFAALTEKGADAVRRWLRPYMRQVEALTGT